MSLDKWIKSDKEKEQETKKKQKKETISTVENQIEKEESFKLNKFRLKCSNSKCNYQKTLMKRQLANKDKKCPRCNSIMKIIES
ncbi:MAG: hypothetical protein EU543_00800 [Promethearchaeota archaeon]|nr:MAG: hypothetical protein EU543_00800 [Candidatus Lokiarchaeota archaeon]